MNSKKHIGNKGEEEAVHFLIANGYEILERNWRYKRAEVDIIAQNSEELVFVEVKTRKNADFGYPEEFVTPEQEERIHETAEIYCDKQNWNGLVRFDIIAILRHGEESNLEHFEDAF